MGDPQSLLERPRLSRAKEHRAQDTRGPQPRLAAHGGAVRLGSQPAQAEAVRDRLARGRRGRTGAAPSRTAGRSEEHTSELQSLMRISYAVFCLKKKNSNITSRK